MNKYIPSLCAFNHCLWHNITCSQCEFCSSSLRGIAFYVGSPVANKYGVSLVSK